MTAKRKRSPASRKRARASGTTVFSLSEEETFDLGRRLAQELRGGEIVSLEGTLGAGKTVFARGIAVGLEIPEEEVSSPTFTLVHEHRGGRLLLYHVDLYRLERAREIETLGLEQLSTPNSVVVVEWGERLPRSFARESLVVRLSDLGEHARRIEIGAPAAPVAGPLDA